MSKFRKLVLSTAVAVTLLLAAGSVAYAQQGSGDAGDSASVVVYNVYAWDRSLTGPSSLTVDVDCHAGDSVLTGYGALYYSTGQGFGGIEQGSALDSDTWRVTFTFSPSARTIMHVNATCLEAS